MNANAKSRKLRLIIFIPLLCWLISCYPSSESELFGTYSAEYESVRASLTLYRNGTFVQMIAAAEFNEFDSTSGQWSYDSETHYVTFDSNFVDLASVLRVGDHIRTGEKFGIHGLPADEYFGTVSIGGSEGVLYKKRSDLK